MQCVQHQRPFLFADVHQLLCPVWKILLQVLSLPNQSQAEQSSPEG